MLRCPICKSEMRYKKGVSTNGIKYEFYGCSRYPYCKGTVEMNEVDEYDCEFPYKSRVMPTSEPLKSLKAPYMARNPMKWGFFRLKSKEMPL